MKKILSVVLAACAAVSGVMLSACKDPAGNGGAELNEKNLNSLVGKTVGVAQLQNVPGLTLRVVLEKYDIDYQIIDSVQAEKDRDKVNLVAMEAPNMTPASGCDYYLCPEPAATTKINGTKDSATPFVLAGDLQKLYGGENGYPQAVLVAKKSLAGDTVTGELTGWLDSNAQYLASAQTAQVLSLLAGARTEGLTPAFNEKTLNASVVKNCSVRYASAASEKTAVNAFLDELIAVSETNAKRVDDSFFYTGDFTAENTVEGKRTLYVPDGAPALSIVNALSKEQDKIEFHVIDAQTIASKVTGETPAADYCILPLNAASKLLGTGSVYQMLGTVTHGNLYFLTVKNS